MKREKAGLTQIGLAHKVGCSQSMIALIEAGKREPKKQIKVKIALFLKVSVEWLFYEQIDDQRSSCGVDSHKEAI